MSRLNQQRIIALLLGLSAVMAGVFTWRAGQLGSAAAFDDRQAVSQTIKQQQQSTEAALDAIGDAGSYVRYVIEFTEAAALDDAADELSDLGATGAAETATERADGLRVSATVQAAVAGVFGRQTAYTQLAAPEPTPQPFDLLTQYDLLLADIQSSIGSPGELTPDRWADRADDTRYRVGRLRVAAFALMVSLVAFTIAQVTDRSVTRLISAGGALAIFLGTIGVTFTTVY